MSSSSEKRTIPSRRRNLRWKIYCPSRTIHFTNQFFDCVSTAPDYDLPSWTWRDTSDGSREKRRAAARRRRNGGGQEKKRRLSSGIIGPRGQGQCVKRLRAAGVFGRGEMKISRRYLSPEKPQPRPYFASHKSINEERTRPKKM